MYPKPVNGAYEALRPILAPDAQKKTYLPAGESGEDRSSCLD